MRQSEARLEGSSRGPSASAWGVPLTSPSLVTHQGKLIAFARAARVDPATAAPTESLFFKVFEPQQAMNAADERAWYGWFQFDFPEAPPRDAVDARAKKEGPPAELRLAGMDLLTVTRDAAAVRPADASFQIVSDDTYLYCFRPSVHGTLYLNRLMLLDASPAYALEVAWEVRYQRSGLRDVPDGETDTQSYTDPAGRPFLEPTIELSQVRDIEGGAFAVARVPVGSDGAAAWYVAAQGGLALHRIDQTSGSVVDLTEAKAYQRLAPTLRSTSTKLTPIAGRAPALAFYTEHDEGKTSSAEQIELQRCGRLMLAIPVFAGGLDPATAIYDFALDLTGRIAELKTAEQQSLVVADGTFENGTFHPADGPSYPTADKAAATVQMVDGLAVDSMLLGQVRPTTDLALRLGEDGRVHLYYGGSPPSAAEIVRIGWSSLTPGAPQAMVARYDPRVSRVQIDVPWIPSQLEQQNPGSVHFVAAQSGSIMGGAKVSIAESACGSDLCDVIVEYPEATKLPAETWHAVPREVSAFAEVLNGGASDDSTDPDVLAGTQAFFDFEGRLPMVRVPVAPNHAGEAAAIETHQPVVTFVSTRAELPLTEVEVGPGRRVVLRFAGMDGAPIEQVWGDLPPSVAAYASIFGGDADAAVYGYERGDGTTPVFALPTDAYGIPAPLVLYATDPGQGVSDLKITVTAPVKVQPTDPELVLHFDRAGERLFSVPATSRAVAVVVDALGKSDHVRALGLVVSAEGVAGNLVADSVAQEADLRDGAALFDLIVTPRAAEHDELEQGRREAFTTSHGFPVGAPEHDLTRLVGFAVSFDRPEIGTAYVATGAGDAEQSVNRRLAGRADASAPQGGSWQRVPPAKACSFDGRNAMTVPVAGRPRSEDLRPQRTWTMESWLLPRGGGDQRVVTFRDAETAVPARAPRLDYRLSLASRRSARFEHGEPGVFYQSAFKANGREETDHRFLNVPEFTYDFWVRPDPVPCPADAPERLGGIVTVAFAWDHKPYFAIGLDRERHVVVRVTEHDVDRDLRSQGPLLLPPDGTADWHHVAVTARQHATTQRWTFELYVDGALDSSMSDVPMQLVLPPEQLPPSLYIGRLRPHDSSVWGDVANLRYWGTARKVDEIRRTAPVALSGSEDGLLGYWPLDDEGTRQKLNVATATKGLWTAMYETHATETEVPQPAAVVADNPFVDAVAAVGGLSAVKASCGLLSGRWNHLAVRFEAGGALDLNPDARLRLGELDWMRVRGDDFTPSTAFAVDAWVSIPKRMPTAGTILSRWAWNDARKQSYKLEVT
ncbi:MAG TPA: LamG-like jellyroll fold domain-containing protein, partial [Thermoleophilaceae bacterium]